jgi:hypothetical protein
MAGMMISVLLTALTFGASEAVAQTRPWCLVETASDGGGSINCGFHTFEQCQASRPGGSSHCSPNPALVGGGPVAEDSQLRNRARRR